MKVKICLALSTRFHFLFNSKSSQMRSDLSVGGKMKPSPVCISVLYLTTACSTNALINFILTSNQTGR